MPLYSGGRPDEAVTSLQQFRGGDVTLEAVNTVAGQIVNLYAETETGGDAPTLTKADCLLIGAALTALGQP